MRYSASDVLYTDPLYQVRFFSWSLELLPVPTSSKAYQELFAASTLLLIVAFVAETFNEVGHSLCEIITR